VDETPTLTRAMHIGSGRYSGNVGIGTTNPGAKLDVNGDIYSTIMYDRDNTGYYVNPAGTSNVNRIIVNYTPTLSSDVATKGYVDEKADSGIRSGCVGHTNWFSEGQTGCIDILCPAGKVIVYAGGQFSGYYPNYEGNGGQICTNTPGTHFFRWACCDGEYFDPPITQDNCDNWHSYYGVCLDYSDQ